MKTIFLPRAGLHRGDLVLVNAEYPCRAERNDLTPAHPGAPTVLLAAPAAGALNRLIAELGGWGQITAVSGWRSRKEQQAIYTQSLRDSGEAFTRQFVALPGCSEHQTGLAIDLARTAAVIDFICPDFPQTGVCRAFRERAADFGFVERYPQGKEPVTGIACEPWHFRYVGTPHAAQMRQRGLVLEEYIDFLRGYPQGHPLAARDEAGMPCTVFFLPAGKAGETCLETQEGVRYTVSGNNADGYIVTARREQ